MQQFEAFRASELYCPTCRAAMPVRERLLLVLPHADLFEYRCTACGASLGTREVRQAPVPARAAVRRAVASVPRAAASPPMRSASRGGLPGPRRSPA